MTPMLSYLVCATPRSGSTLLCHALDSDGRRRSPGGVLRGARALGAAATSARVLRPGAPRQHRRAPRLSRDARRGGQAEPAVAPGDLRPVPRLGAGGGHDANGVFGAKLMWGYLGDFAELLRGIDGMAGRPLPELLGTRVSRSALRPDHAREQDPPGGVAVEGRADAGVEGRRRGRAPVEPCSRSARSTTWCAS